MSERGVFTALGLTFIVMFAAYAGGEDKSEAERELMRYCERVVQFEAAAARGVPIEQRYGHADYRNIAAESCPGLRPAE